MVWVFPTLRIDRAVAHPLVNGFPYNQHQSCSTFEEARSILEEHGYTSLWFLEGPTDGPSLKAQKNKLDLADAKVTYAVAKGREIGVFSTYRSVKTRYLTQLYAKLNQAYDLAREWNRKRTVTAEHVIRNCPARPRLRVSFKRPKTFKSRWPP